MMLEELRPEAAIQGPSPDGAVMVVIWAQLEDFLRVAPASGPATVGVAPPLAPGLRRQLRAVWAELEPLQEWRTSEEDRLRAHLGERGSTAEPSSQSAIATKSGGGN
jgi:hypothetical protein